MMKNIDERLNNFREDMNILMENVKPSENLKRKVKNKAFMKDTVSRGHKKSFSLVASFLCIALTISIFQVPVVRAQALSTLSDLITWVRETTNLPIYLPNSWQPIKQNTADEDTDTTQNYYFELSGDERFYNINVYKVKVPVKFNDKNDLLEKNGPISESDFVGTISGEKITSSTPDLSNNIPKDAESFEFIPGVTAYKKYQETALWWEYKEWNFEFNGSSISLDVLKELAATWAKADVQGSKTGKVIITGGNKLTFDFMWDKQGYRYTYITTSMDFNGIINILNSFSMAE